MPPISEMRFGRVALVGLGITVISIVLTVLVVTIYAVILGIQAQGAPDRDQIANFTVSVGSWLGILFGLLLTFLGSTWTARRVPHHKALHGLLVGVFVAILSIALDAIGGLAVMDVVGFVLTVGAGWLGGVVGAGRRSEV